MSRPTSTASRNRQPGGRIAPALLVCFLAAACSGTAPPPEPGQSRGFPPDLRGRRVILLPVQQVLGVDGDPYAELVYGLTDRGRDVDWVLADEVDEILARSPAIQARTHGLPVGAFLQAVVERVGDPLFGELRRMAGLVSAEAIVLPIQASYEPNATIVNSNPRVRFTLALIEPRSGRVVWFGVEEGGDFSREDPRALASAVDAVARTLLWYVGE